MLGKRSLLINNINIFYYIGFMCGLYRNKSISYCYCHRYRPRGEKVLLTNEVIVPTDASGQK